MKRITLLAALAACQMASPAHANDAELVELANSTFTAAGTGTTAQTAGEYLICSAHWGKWNEWLATVSDPESLEGLQPELSAENAEQNANDWYDRGTEKVLIDYGGTAQYLAKLDKDAQELAERNYAKWVNQDPNRGDALLDWLRSCK